MAHPAAKIPEGPHGKLRYERAKKHAAAAKAKGKSSEEIHAIFKRVLAFDPIKDTDKIPDNEAHAKYKSAIIHMKSALARGASSDEAHDMYKRIMAGTAGKHKKA